ncbi:hypothetical protein GCM10025864_20040 [Luteimicrobium album]|uniref:Uncharacterized protein n=2 Tax=Luteimicrobium album TaxID=1054550 RepID=A0ABQ6I0S4_9MICO|nr:hypothetical protein GCM10025864_20040 [Luteimicrobium album]
MRSTLVAIDTATGEQYVLVDDKGADVFGPKVSPDGRFVAYVRETVTTPHRAPEVTLAVVALAPSRARAASRRTGTAGRRRSHGSPTARASW